MQLISLSSRLSYQYTTIERRRGIYRPGRSYLQKGSTVPTEPQSMSQNSHQTFSEFIIVKRWKSRRSRRTEFETSRQFSLSLFRRGRFVLNTQSSKHPADVCFAFIGNFMSNFVLVLPVFVTMTALGNQTWMSGFPELFIM